ncbi:MAG: dockerin type I repeat-containing protein [Planctomycetes bacterium]|nr:dockerin type I repeat-containing protein [Planctomycetota bacterium]
MMCKSMAPFAVVCMSVGIGEAQEVKGFFGPPEVIATGVGGNVFGQTPSEDERTLYFSRYQGDPRGDVDIYILTRTDRSQPFSVPARPVEGLDSPFEDWVSSCCLSAGGEEIYFTSTRTPSCGFQDLFVARFNVPGDPEGGFAAIENLGDGVNATGKQANPNISRDGLRLYFRSGPDFYVARRKTEDDLFGNPVLLSWKLGAADIFAPTISWDERTLFWTDDRQGSEDIWMATRESVFDDFGQPVPFDHPAPLGSPINTPAYEAAPTPTADWPAPGSGLYFSRDATTLLRAPWHPDCNGNRRDDIEEIEQGEVEDVDGNGVPDECEAVPPVRFLRGDCNADGDLNISDPVYSLAYQFADGPAPACVKTADVNDDGILDLGDPVFMLNYLFASGTVPPPPLTACGPDPTDDDLDCVSYAPCRE